MDKKRYISKNKLINVLRAEMDIVFQQITKSAYARAFYQGKFDILMDLDRALKIGAFGKQGN